MFQFIFPQKCVRKNTTKRTQKSRIGRRNKYTGLISKDSHRNKQVDNCIYTCVPITSRKEARAREKKNNNITLNLRALVLTYVEKKSIAFQHPLNGYYARLNLLVCNEKKKKKQPSLLSELCRILHRIVSCDECITYKK